MELGNIDFCNTYDCRFVFLNPYLRVSFNIRLSTILLQHKFCVVTATKIRIVT